MPIVATATSGSLCSASDGVELSATRSQISCARRSDNPLSLMNDSAASAPFTSKRLGPDTLAVRPMSWNIVPIATTSVVVDSLHAADRFSEQPGTHRVIEQIRFGESLRVLNHGGDEWTVGYADACNQSSH